jgi:serine/threonine-protein kinase
MISTAGRVLSDRYRIDDVLGTGGMAAVWRGRDLRLDRPVAIKELAGPWLRDPTAMTRFDREARTAARLAHPNIVAVHDVGSDGDSRYLVMELIEGTSVAALLDNGPLPVDQVVTIAAQTCDALAAAHAAGVVHRDIKPANLIVAPDGVVKVCDFGIARALSEVADLNLTGPAVAMGSTSYIAPEQVAGDPIDGRADLYSLGCTMYAMLTGAPPFTGESPMQVLDRHLNDPPVPVLRRRTDTPPALAALVGRLLAKKPADRPANAAEVKARLLALTDEPTGAVPVTRPARRRRRWYLAAASGVAAAAIAAAVALAMPEAVPGATTRDDRPGAGAGAATPGGTPAPASAPGQPVGQPAGSAGLTGSPGASGAPPTAPTTPTVTTGPPPTTPAPPPVDPVAAIRESISVLAATGHLHPKGAEELGRKVDEYVRAMARRDLDEAAKKVREMRDKLADLFKKHEVSTEGRDRLSRDIDALGAAINA